MIMSKKNLRISSTCLIRVDHNRYSVSAAIRVVRDRILKQDQDDRAFVELLLMTRAMGDDSLETLEIACDLTLQTGVVAAAMVLNEMRRLTDAERPKVLSDVKLSLPTLQLEPEADCARYDRLRSLQHEH
jgi:hypothetical protein